MNYLGKLKIDQKTGNENFIYNGNNLDKKIMDFWKWSVSDLISNTTRGAFAEFIVGMAMEADMTYVREEWDAYDIKTKDGIKIEVKASAYLQTWLQKDFSKIIFSIKPAYYWNSETNEISNVKSRPSDIYVFCVLKHKDKNTINPLILDQWDFYVVSTKIINEQFGNQNTLQLRSLENITKCVSYDELREKIKKEYVENNK
jgi:hypothetical protein